MYSISSSLFFRSNHVLQGLTFVSHMRWNKGKGKKKGNTSLPLPTSRTFTIEEPKILEKIHADWRVYSGVMGSHEKKLDFPIKIRSDAKFQSWWRHQLEPGLLDQSKITFSLQVTLRTNVSSLMSCQRNYQGEGPTAFPGLEDSDEQIHYPSRRRGQRDTVIFTPVRSSLERQARAPGSFWIPITCK